MYEPKKMHVGGISCDLGKVIYYVTHEISLVYLQFYGFRHVVKDCFRCYVRNGRQEVEVT
jgi:hypothetical protein